MLNMPHTCLMFVLLWLVTASQGHPTDGARNARQVFFPIEMDSCWTPNGNPGKCVLLSECPPLFQLLEVPSRKVFKYLRSSGCGFVHFDPKVCCSILPPPLELVLADPLPIAKPLLAAVFRPVGGLFNRPIPPGSYKPATINRPSSPGSIRPNKIQPPINVEAVKPDEKPILAQRPKPSPPIASGRLPESCGTTLVARDHIVSGDEAKKGAWPWMTFLLKGNKMTGDVDGMCSGVLITNQHILTTAQCVDQEDQIVVAVLGETEYGHEASSDPVKILVSDIILHEDFDKSVYKNDIAILTLSETVTFNEKILPICLPMDPMLRTQNFTKRLLYVAGWDSNSDGVIGGEPHVVLKEDQAPVVSQATCKLSYKNYDSAVIDESVICSGFPGSGKDSCDGDAGGPLMCPEGDRFQLVGLVSNGKGCGQPGYPRIYTRVAHYVDWIVSKISE